MLINYRPLCLGIGMFLTKLASLMLAPAALALWFNDVGGREFLISSGIAGLAGISLIRLGRHYTTGHFQLGIREMFLLTTLVWVVVTAFAALPFIFIDHIPFSDAFFETMSGLTTTGSTVLSGLDSQPHSILLWRSLLNWLGGIGFIVTGVAIFPFLNVGGMRLFQTESSEWSDKSVPKTKVLAGQLLRLYFLFTLVCTLAYLLCGMTVFEAINHAMSTIATGGFSTSDNSMSQFSHGAHWVAIIFMTLSSLPFLLMVQSWQRRKLGKILADSQVRGLLKLLIGATLLLTVLLYHQQHLPLIDAFRVSAFNVVTVVSTTGYGLGDFTQWGSVVLVLMFLLMFTGGCSGSTSGAIKVFRYQIVFRLLSRQLKQQIHPRSVSRLSYNRRPVNDGILHSIITFLITYTLTIGGVALVMAMTGLDSITSLTGAVTAVSNVGPGLTQEIGPAGNFAHLPALAKWAMSAGMLMGRLEILTVLVLFSPHFWSD